MRLQTKLENDLTQEDYRVYSAFLRAQLKGSPDDDLRVGPMGSPLVADIEVFSKPMKEEYQSYIESQLPNLQREALTSQQECAPKPFVLERKLDVPTDYQLVSKWYPPGDLGKLRFSCIGFNRSKTQAFFFVERYYCFCAVGKWILMRKNSDGNWAIDKEMIAWIS